MENFTIEVDGDGIALITFDVPGRSMNTVTLSATRDLVQVVERIKTDASIKGAILRSGKETGFCAGADLSEMEQLAGVETTADDVLAVKKEVFETVGALSRAFRALETCGKPVAAALEGLALGGGFEMVLACHYRVAADNPKSQFGLPESKIGLLPGAGGTQRLPRLIGLQAAAGMILEGQSKKPAEAKALGLVHELVPPGEAVNACRKWLASNPKAVAPWDEKGYRFKEGPYAPAGAMLFIGGIAMMSKQTSLNYPAQRNIMSCFYEGLQLPMDAALRVELRYFANTIVTPEAKGMIRTLFNSMQALSKGSNRPQGIAKSDPKKVAVLGAGMMGAGIAYVQAMAGIQTVLIDRDQEAADKGKAHVKDLLDKAVAKKRMDQTKADSVLALVTATPDYSLIKGSDLVIEAVFEDRNVKAEVTKKAEAYLDPTAIFGSNTSTLPITTLAEASARPKNFIGVHFFSPVDRMGLVELIVGKKTSQEAIAKAIDYVLKIRKTPIIVNDARGFYTSRVFSTYVREGAIMLAEGVKPAIIENVGHMTGMPRAPLEMADDVALDLIVKIARATKVDLGVKYQATPADGVFEAMVNSFGRQGRKNAKGFYEYPADPKAKKVLWTGLSEIAKPVITECPPALRDEYKKRLLYIQALETARCFEEKVITDPRDADVGSILAWGFAPYSGGVISLMDCMGLDKFVAECDVLAKKYGARFKPCKLLRDMAKNGESFYGRFGGEAAKAAA
ncbi:MAG: 3-hydroxyacyl-CoA dehydrogenase NAD-binding domain-containing protein [Caulobacterales bacterium]